MKLTLPWPPSVNHYWRTFIPKGQKRPVTTRSEEGKAYMEAANNLFMAAGIRPVDGLVQVRLVFFRPRKTGDLDNHLKVILDAMQGHVYYNDSQVRHIEATLYDDKYQPRVEVEVSHWQDERGIGNE